MKTAARSRLVVVALVMLAGCGGDDDSDDTAGTEEPTTTTAAPSTDETSAPTTVADDGAGSAFPETPVTAVLDSTYPAGGFDAESFGLDAGSVSAAWYAAGDRWAVHYVGLTPDTASGKCPGNSIQTDAGFEYISNSPYGALACAGYEELPNYAGAILPPGSLFRCGDSDVVYVTEIPLTAEGTLYGSLEQMRDDGVVQGMTSMVVADAAGAPEIDLSDCGAVS